VLFVTDRKPISQKRDIDVGLANEERLHRISQRGGRTLLATALIEPKAAEERGLSTWWGPPEQFAWQSFAPDYTLVPSSLF